MLWEHGRTLSTGKFKILKPGCMLIFSLPVSCKLELSRNAEAGRSGRGSQSWHVPVLQDRFSPCSRHLEEPVLHNSTPGSQGMLQEKTSLKFMQWKCCGKILSGSQKPDLIGKQFHDKTSPVNSSQCILEQHLLLTWDSACIWLQHCCSLTFCMYICTHSIPGLLQI